MALLINLEFKINLLEPIFYISRRFGRGYLFFRQTHDCIQFLSKKILGINCPTNLLPNRLINLHDGYLIVGILFSLPESIEFFIQIKSPVSKSHYASFFFFSFVHRQCTLLFHYSATTIKYGRNLSFFPSHFIFFRPRVILNKV